MANFAYAACYCEENVYRLLCDTLDPECPFEECFAVVVSAFACAPAREVPNQWESIVPYRPCRDANVARDLVIWDYHVIAVVTHKDTHRHYVIDFDSKLPPSADVTAVRWKDVCIDFDVYVRETFVAAGKAPFAVRGKPMSYFAKAVRFRVITRGDYLCFLRSDRTHMLDSSGQYTSPPPPWDQIQDFHPTTTSAAKARYEGATVGFTVAHKSNTLVSFINTTNTKFPGEVLSISAFTSRFE